MAQSSDDDVDEAVGVLAKYYPLEMPEGSRRAWLEYVERLVIEKAWRLQQPTPANDNGDAVLIALPVVTKDPKPVPLNILERVARALFICSSAIPQYSKPKTE